MPYSRNFGMRSFENIVRDGRAKIPSDFDEDADGTLWLGTAVKVDPDTGNLTRPDDSEAPSQLCGVLVYEHIQLQGVDPALTSPQDEPFNKAPKGRYAQMIHGQGAKIWLKNTTAKTLYDGRTQGAVTLVAGLGATPTVAVGDYLTPAADGTWQEGTATNGWLVVEQVDGDRVECRFTF